MGNGFQFIDIIIFAMIAAYLVFRLRNVLGKRDDNDTENGFQDLFNQDPSNDDNVVHLQDPHPGNLADADTDDLDEADPLSIGLRQIKDADSSFHPGQFADGANMAFEMILNAYTDGDTAVLKNLLNGDVFGNFNKAITDREQAGETLEDTLVDIKSNTVVEAYMQGTQAFVTVKFVTEQVNATRDENGDVVDGNPNKIITVTDFWTFARDTKSRDPNWKLVATRSLD